MWLTLDIGNSAVKGGLFRASEMQHVFTVTSEAANPEAVRTGWEEALRAELGAFDVSRIGITSVVPAVASRVTAAVEAITGVRPEAIHPSMHLPFEMTYRTPETLGTDRLAAAVGAWTGYGAASDGSAQSVVAIDAGTALTYEVIRREGVYLGGAIAPGPGLLRRALHEGTAQLPEVPLSFPADIIGRSTREAIQAGTMSTVVDSVRGMLDRIRDTLDDDPVVVVTGGWHALLAEHVDGIDHLEPHLVLYGIRDLLALNPPRE